MLVLWDIDGTLLSAGGVGAEVFDDALEATLGLRPSERLPMSGKTDPQIVHEYLELLDVDEPHRHVAPILEQLEIGLRGATTRIREEGRVHPGVVELIEALASRGDVIQSVLTGNIAPNAVVKLAAFGLEHRLELEIGAFGSDRADRNELVPIAVERAREAHGFASGASLDHRRLAERPRLRAAGGARCLLVATGRHGLEELAALEPEAVVPDLGRTDEILAILLEPSLA